MTFTLLEGPDVRLSVRDTEFDLSSAQPEHTVALADQGPKLTERISLTPLTGATREDGSVITAGMPTIPEELHPDWAG